MAHLLKMTKPIGLLTLVLTMAFGANAAQAEIGAHWNVSGSAVTNALKAQVQVTEIETLPSTGVKEVILLTLSGGTKVEILCTAVKVVDALLTEKGGATGKLHFEGCVTKLNEKPPAAACKPHSPGHPEGLIETNALDALIKLHKVSETQRIDLIEVLPTTGTVFVMLILGLEGPELNECAIGELFDITGKAFLKDGQNELLVEKKEHLFQEGPLSALLFGGNAAIIDGSVRAALIGAHTGLNWSGIAA